MVSLISGQSVWAVPRPTSNTATAAEMCHTATDPELSIDYCTQAIQSRQLSRILETVGMKTSEGKNPI
jgi:hypothetical protein